MNYIYVGSISSVLMLDAFNVLFYLLKTWGRGGECFQIIKKGKENLSLGVD